MSTDRTRTTGAPAEYAAEGCGGDRGFSLVELMVGIAIGLIGILIMFRMVSMWETRSRTTTAGGDAQVSGTLAMFNLERDLRAAGMGFGAASSPFMGCTVQAQDVLTSRSFTFPLYPVLITAGVPAGAPDEIRVLYGNSSFYVAQEALTGATASTKILGRRGGFRPGDLAVVAGNPTGLPGGASCDLVEITAVNDPDNRSVGHDTLPYASFYATASAPQTIPRYNAAGGAGGTYTSGAVYNLGPAPQLNVWHVADRSLKQSEVIRDSPAIDVAAGVINLKAQYGIDANGDGQVAATEWAASAPTNWTRVLAMRMAVLVRSSQFEPGSGATPFAVTASAPNWAGGAFAMTNVDGSADSFSVTVSDPNNWRFYRYKVYEKVVPLRNMIWGTAP